MDRITLREVERESIRVFLERHTNYFCGQSVLDFGCGMQPYRELIENAGGRYVGFDRQKFPGNVSMYDVGMLPGKIDTVVCTQVIQYLPNPQAIVEMFRGMAKTLVMTGPTNWPVVEDTDLWRFTPAGVKVLLDNAGWTEYSISVRGRVRMVEEPWILGWGVVAR